MDPGVAGRDPIREDTAAFAELAAIVSHELRAHVNSILLWATELRRDSTISAERTRHALEIIERNARAQAQLAEDLIDLSAIIDGKQLQLSIASTDLASIATAAVETARPGADARRIGLDLQLPRQLYAMADPRRVQQVVGTLISSAIKFSPAGRGPVSIQMKRMDSNAEIRVSSSAGGINRESLSHVFDRFCAEERTGARRFGQLGLGLALVREIVDAHGGTVRVDSHGEERGVTFTVRLPRRSQASPSTRRTSSDSDWPSQGFVR